MQEVEKPIGDFILKNADGVQTENGKYYSYQEVCTLLKNYKKQFSLQGVVVPNGTLSNLDEVIKKAKPNMDKIR